MSEILNKIITVSSVETSDKKTVIKDQDGKKFNVWHTKKDGTPSKASVTMQQYGVKAGSTVEISYTEEDFVADGKQLKSKRVMSFAPTTGNPAPKNIVGDTGHLPQPDTHGEILGTSGILQAMLAGGVIQEVDEPAIRKALAATRLVRLIVSGQETSFANSLRPAPQQQSEEEINVEDIPFR
jgi:hypothetical protein